MNDCAGSLGGDQRVDRGELARSAIRFRGRHHGPEPLVVPNAWDAASARLIQQAGFEAVATTSGGIAASLGVEDHEAMSADQMFRSVELIARAVSVPVSGDVESGYGLAPDELVDRILAAGLVGMNLEDTDHRRGELAEPHGHAARLAAIKEAARAVGVDLVLNARVDVFLRGAGSLEDRLKEALARAGLYREAGADCVFPIMLTDEGLIGRFVAEAGAPVNILAVPDGPSLPRLAEIGVARVSFGSGLHRRALQAVAGFLHELRSQVKRP